VELHNLTASHRLRGYFGVSPNLFGFIPLIFIAIFLFPAFVRNTVFGHFLRLSVIFCDLLIVAKASEAAFMDPHLRFSRSLRGLTLKACNQPVPVLGRFAHFPAHHR
jgi:hypothetical protein